MSEGVELVGRIIEAINRADFAAAVASVSKDFELDFSNSRAELSGIYRGRDETKAFLASFWEPWETARFDPEEEITELEDGRVLSVIAVRGRGSGSGAEVAATGATVWTIHGGEVVAAKMYQSKAEALEAAS